MSGFGFFLSIPWLQIVAGPALFQRQQAESPLKPHCQLLKLVMLFLLKSHVSGFPSPWFPNKPRTGQTTGHNAIILQDIHGWQEINLSPARPPGSSVTLNWSRRSGGSLFLYESWPPVPSENMEDWNTTASTSLTRDVSSLFSLRFKYHHLHGVFPFQHWDTAGLISLMHNQFIRCILYLYVFSFDCASNQSSDNVPVNGWSYQMLHTMKSKLPDRCPLCLGGKWSAGQVYLQPVAAILRKGGNDLLHFSMSPKFLFSDVDHRFTQYTVPGECL